MRSLLKKAFIAVMKFLTPVRLAVIAAVLFFFWFVVMGDRGVNQIRLLLEMKHDLAVKKKGLEDGIESLSRERDLLEKPENLEMTIRKELGFIRPGEVVFERRPPAEKGIPRPENNDNK